MDTDIAGARDISVGGTSLVHSVGKTSMSAVNVCLEVDSAGRAHVRTSRPCAWVTLLTSDSYVKGVVCLARSLAESKTAFSLIVMVTPNLKPETLTALDAEVCTVRMVERLCPLADDQMRVHLASPRFSDCWTKLHMWTFEEYAVIGYLDADMCIVKNMDWMFGALARRECALLAVQECFCFLKDPKRRVKCPYRGPGGWARFSTGIHKPGCDAYFNGGLMVLRPSRATFKGFLDALAGVDPADYPFAEQDFLNVHLRGAWDALPFGVNAMKCFYDHHRNDGLWAHEDVYNIHFTHSKPWDLRADHKGYGLLNRCWWQLYLRGNPRLSAAALERMLLVMLVRAKSTRHELGSGAGDTQASVLEAEPSDDSSDSSEDDQYLSQRVPAQRAQSDAFTNEPRACTLGAPAQPKLGGMVDHAVPPASRSVNSASGGGA